jgi:hypothetical protein
MKFATKNRFKAIDEENPRDEKEERITALETNMEEIKERLHSFNKDLRRIIRAIDRLSGGKDVWKKGKGDKK